MGWNCTHYPEPGVRYASMRGRGGGVLHPWKRPFHSHKPRRPIPTAHMRAHVHMHRVCHKNDVTVTAPCANGHVPRMCACVRCTYVGSCAFHVQHAKRSLATTGSMDTEYTPVLAARTPASSRGTSLASQPSRPASGPLPGAALHATRDTSSQHHAHVIGDPVP